MNGKIMLKKTKNRFVEINNVIEDIKKYSKK